MQLGGDFSEKCGKKGISMGYQCVIFPRGQLFTSLLGEPYQAYVSMDTAEKNKKSVEQFGTDKRKNKTKKIIATHFVTSLPSQCYSTIVIIIVIIMIIIIIIIIIIITIIIIIIIIIIIRSLLLSLTYIN